jgi:hypothetical protein
MFLEIGALGKVMLDKLNTLWVKWKYPNMAP